MRENKNFWDRNTGLYDCFMRKDREIYVIAGIWREKPWNEKKQSAVPIGMTGDNNFYDGMITCSTLSGKAVCRLVWAMNKAENDAYLEKALSGIPDIFPASCWRCRWEPAF